MPPQPVEVCNGFDDDCDGETDEGGAEGCVLRFADHDRDGFGLVTGSACVCVEAPPHDAERAGDCDDERAASHPAAVERCNGHDDDCDGVSDEAGAEGCEPVFFDGDEDGYGVDGTDRCLCGGGEGASRGGDCNDGSAAVSPGAEERCNHLDDDCDGETDEGFDSDGDGVIDCEDSEECDGEDNDGDGEVDEGFDSDGDGTADCFDVEECDGEDNDGDGEVDEGFEDEDGDGAADCVDPCPTYVDVSAGATQADGTSWRPFGSLVEGVAAARAGGCATLRVRPGVYNEAVELGEGGLRVEATAGATETILDGSGLGASIVTVRAPAVAGVAADELAGFTLRGGGGTPGDGDFGAVGLRHGGALLAVDAELAVEGCVFETNSVDGEGGAVLAVRSEGTVSETTMRDNAAAIAGGALRTVSSSLTMSGLVLQGNSVTSEGGLGGAYAADGSTDALRRSHVFGNTAPLGVLVQSGAGGSVLSSNVIQDNAADAVVIRNSNSSVVANNTIVANAGHGIWATACCGHTGVSPLVKNNAVAHNAGHGIQVDIPSMFTVGYNNFFSNAGGSYGGHLNDLTGRVGNIAANPRFRSFSADGAANDDFYLRAASPCVDAGNDVLVFGVSADFLGRPLPVDGDGDGLPEFDIGALERVP